MSLDFNWNNSSLKGIFIKLKLSNIVNCMSLVVYQMILSLYILIMFNADIIIKILFLAKQPGSHSSREIILVQQNYCLLTSSCWFNRYRKELHSIILYNFEFTVRSLGWLCLHVYMFILTNYKTIEEAVWCNIESQIILINP